MGRLFDKWMNKGIDALHGKAQEHDSDADKEKYETVTLADMPRPIFAKVVTGVGAVLLLSVLVILTYRMTQRYEAFALFVLPLYFGLGVLQTYIAFRKGRIYSCIGVCRSAGGGIRKSERVRSVSFDVKEDSELVCRTYRVVIRKGEFATGMPYRLYFNESNPSALFAWESVPQESQEDEDD